jgi:hypothetical protein
MASAGCSFPGVPGRIRRQILESARRTPESRKYKFIKPG